MSDTEESNTFKCNVASSVLFAKRGGVNWESPLFTFTTSNKNKVQGRIFIISFWESNGQRYAYFSSLADLHWEHTPINVEFTISISGQAWKGISCQTKIMSAPRRVFFDEVELFPSFSRDETIITIQLEFKDLNEEKLINTICESLHTVKESKVDSIYEKLLFDESINDIKLILDEEQYPAHKVVLAANSPVFHRMFSHEMKETLSKEVEIKEIHPEVFKELLKYMYTKKVDKFKALAGELFIAADRYEMEELKFICERELMKGLNVGNVLKSIIFADRHNAVNLKKHSVYIIMRNFAQIVEKDEFKDFVKSHPNFLMELNQEMAVKCEIKIKKF